MSFGSFARKVRAAELPYGRRVSALCSCVERYGPIGFQYSLSFLREIAGPYRTDEDALLHALDALMASRALWQAAVRSYADARRQAKRRGQRGPRPDDPNPNRPDRWYGDARRAALHVMRHEQAELGRLAGTVGAGSVEAELSEMVDASIAAAGAVPPDGVRRLAAIGESLRGRITAELYKQDPRAYNHLRRLHRVVLLIAAASDPETMID